METPKRGNHCSQASRFSCEHCERTITNALTPMSGVRTVNVDIAAKQVHIDYDNSQVSVDRIKNVLLDEDYPVESVA
ncbi:MAG: heavy-metal-associated domain-containing protein [Chloroflexi bacterium]|nr:heavy-metal-associated domain-containing protein [Chloroflexota bacterium]